MKRILCCIITVIMLLSVLSACNNSALDDDSAKSESISEEKTSDSDSSFDSVDIPESKEPFSDTENETEKEPEETPAMLPEIVKDYVPLNYEKMKALWISQYDMQSVYSDSSVQRNEESFRKLVCKVLDNTVSLGFNTIILQVRPFADSMYPSEVYPQSYFVNKKYGRLMKYDPLAIIVDEAHTRSLSVQGWINPMRGMTTSEISLIDDTYLIKKFYSNSETKGKYVVNVGGRLYLNPAYEEVRKLIVDGAVEILSHYKVDGIHMDDYFYPTVESSFDSKAFLEFGNGRTLKQFRYDSLNKLVSELYSAVKETREGALFGISPSGIIDKVTSEHFADVNTWCSESGYVDYICPQLYFGFEHSTCAFDMLFERWANTVTYPDIKLYIGMSLGKALAKEDKYAGAGKTEWANHTDILARELKMLLESDTCDGVAYFCYQYFYDPTTGAEEVKTREERENFLPIFKDMWKDSDS